MAATRRQVTHVQIAEELEMQPRAISRRMRGEADWSAVELLEVSHLLGLSLDELREVVLEQTEKATA